MDHPELNALTKILLVDGSPEVLKFLSLALGKVKCHVLSANNGADALRQSKNDKDEIQLLLSDFQVPGMNGIELATAITAGRPKIEVWHPLPDTSALNRSNGLN